jgi:hypothetical protein
MKNLRFAATLFFVLLLSLFTYSCKQEGAVDDQLTKKVQALETKVDSLQKQLEDQTLKSQIASSVIFMSPLQQFFHNSDFWKKVYDSGQADCAKRCIDTTTAERKECAKKTTDSEKLKCYQDASDRAANCQRGCSHL